MRAGRCGRVKVVYCDHCKDISIKSRLEKDACTTCGRAARPVPYSRPWQYYAGSGILLAATGVLVLAPIPEILIRLAIFGIAAVSALGLTSWSIQVMRARVLRSVQETKQPEAPS